MTKLVFLQFFPTTGRDELYDDHDQLFNEGIDLDRASDFADEQDIEMSHRSMFSPTYEETRIDYYPLRRVRSFRRVS